LKFFEKVPNVAWQLAGCKKVQQVLADANVLRKYAGSQSDEIRKSFAGLFPLSADSISLALNSPNDFVLKPQREGGGNNFYGEDLAKRLRELRDREDEWGAYILMERLLPKGFRNYVLRNDICSAAECTSELGVYCGIVIRGNSVISNRPLGHLLRTKYASANETGVAAGFGALDSPRLI
jgi:glutathione synthetase